MPFETEWKRSLKAKGTEMQIFLQQLLGFVDLVVVMIFVMGVGKALGVALITEYFAQKKKYLDEMVKSPNAFLAMSHDTSGLPRA